MTLETALAKLFSLHQFGIKLGLDSTHKLLKHLGDPQNKLNAFHIAGSNGKGSTASFMASILTESGYKVGLYTSPHLVKFNERIRINGATIPDCYILTFMEELDEYININEPTFFELTTAMAFKYFAESNLDYAVIETGLGGRLDSTNVFNAIASIITTISDEHSNILGDTLTKIAIEKAGIIKNNSFVFCGMLNDEALNVIETVASQRKSDLTKLVDRVNSSGNSLLLKGTNKDYHLYSLPLRGRHQLNNAALAILAINKMMPNISSANIFNGLNNVLVNSGLQGRYEVYNNTPKVIFDSAHNSEGIDAFLDEFKNEDQSKKKSIIYGAMKDKNILYIFSKISEVFDEIFITSIDYERAATIDELMSIANSNGIKVSPLHHPSELILEKMRRNVDEILVVLGSIYLLGEIKSNLLKDMS